MNNILQAISGVIASTIIGVAGIFGLQLAPKVDLSPQIEVLQQQVSDITDYVNKLTNVLGLVEDKQTKLGAAIPLPVAGFETSLTAKITASSTAMTLVSATNKDGNLLSGFYGFVIDEGTADEEFVTANCVSTACTFVNRGVSVSTGNTEVFTLKKAHRRGSSIKISDHPVLTVMARIMNGNETFPNKLSYNSHPDINSANDITDKYYVDNVAIVGSPKISTTTPGIGILANSEILNNFTTTTGASESPYLIRAFDFATSTDKRGATTTPIMSKSNGKIWQGWTDLSEDFTYTGDMYFNASTTIGDSSTTDSLRVNASTTIIGLTQISGATTTLDRPMMINPNSANATSSSFYNLATIGYVNKFNFGSWLSSSTYSFATPYLAATDGFVSAWGNMVCVDTDKVIISGFTNNLNPPTREITRNESMGSAEGRAGANILFPVRKGDYWMASTTAECGGTVKQPFLNNLFWLPFGQ